MHIKEKEDPPIRSATSGLFPLRFGKHRQVTICFLWNSCYFINIEWKLRNANNKSKLLGYERQSEAALREVTDAQRPNPIEWMGGIVFPGVRKKQKKVKGKVQEQKTVNVERAKWLQITCTVVTPAKLIRLIRYGRNIAHGLLLHSQLMWNSNRCTGTVIDSCGNCYCLENNACPLSSSCLSDRFS